MLRTALLSSTPAPRIQAGKGTEAAVLAAEGGGVCGPAGLALRLLPALRGRGAARGCRVAEELLQHLDVAAVPGDLDRVADRALDYLNRPRSILSSLNGNILFFLL